MAKSNKAEKVAVSNKGTAAPKQEEKVSENKTHETIAISYPKGYKGRKDTNLPEGLTFETTVHHANKLRKKGIVKK